MTKRELYTTIATVMSTNKEVVDFCNHEIELLDGRKSRIATKKSLGNASLVALILEGLSACGEPVTITDLQNRFEPLSIANGYSNQKLSATLRKMVEDGVVVKTTDKRKSYFEAVATEEGEEPSEDTAE